MIFKGKSIIACEFKSTSNNTFSNTEYNNLGKIRVYEASDIDIDLALTEARSAFIPYKTKNVTAICKFLEIIAENIDKRSDKIIPVAIRETGLNKARLEGEMRRTVNQIIMFSREIESGNWLEARIDTAVPDRKPNPKPDLRQIRTPIGPVVVFSASNFPLAFSVAGGDTISALAAQNPVVVKAHPVHPLTSEIVAKAIISAVKKAGMPKGIFSMVHGKNNSCGEALVKHALTRAVTFTGSLAGGRALFDIASNRPEPIPVFAEMGSINPVFLMPDSLNSDTVVMAGLLADSITLGAGQFCTNPGLIVTIKDGNQQQFLKHLARLISEKEPHCMLYQQLYQCYKKNLENFLSIAGVLSLTHNPGHKPDEAGRPVPALFLVPAVVFLKQKQLAEENFGPSSLIVECSSITEMKQVAQNLQGQLTATVWTSDSESADLAELLILLQEKAGRILFNGIPTGVEVCPSMFHGGPYPASTNLFSSSVGTLALRRFSRPACFQDFPDSRLPIELRNRNLRGILRLVNNEFTRKDL